MEQATAQHVVVIGPGLMGAQIGVEYALGGHAVTMIARQPDQVAERVARAFRLASEAGLADADTVEEARSRATVMTSLDDLATDADIVVESVVEALEVKIAALKPAAARWPAAIIASNTSSLSITALGTAIEAAERTIGTHYWNPPLLMPLVELISGELTSDDTVRRMTTTLQALSKRPVCVARDVPGFVWNRLQLALLREAAWIVENGVASPAIVDEIVRDGLARRWRLTGPFETVSLGGADTFTRIAANLFPVLSDAERLDDVGRWLIESPEVLQATRVRRDAGLVEELRRDTNPDHVFTRTESD